MTKFTEEQLRVIRKYGADANEVRQDIDEIKALHKHLADALKVCGVGSSPTVFCVAIGTILAETAHNSVVSHQMNDDEAKALLEAVLKVTAESTEHLFNVYQKKAIQTPTSNTKH